MYENLATKYRPKTFDEVIGQDSIIHTLSNALKLGRIAHAYLFYGPRGCGKTTVARILAKSLNCHHPKDGKPCNKCVSCLEISESKSIDVLEIDAASNTQVDKVREIIIENVNFIPARDKRKIYILDEVHMLSASSFNALLKTVEEPPPHVVFMMATTEHSKVPATIVSRCQGFRFRLIPEDLIVGRLKDAAEKEKLKTEPEALKIIARFSGGAMRDALTVLDRAASFTGGRIDAESVKELLGLAKDDLIKEIITVVLERDFRRLHNSFAKISAEGYDVGLVLRDMRNAFAEAFLSGQGFSKTERPLIKEICGLKSPGVFARLVRKMNKIIEETRFSDSPEMAAETALFTIMEIPLDLESLIKRLETLEEKIDKRTDTFSTPRVGTSTRGVGAADRQELAEGGQPVQPCNPGIWKRLLEAISSQKPMLYNIMLSSKVDFKDDKTWKFIFKDKFGVQTLEKYKKEIEDLIQQISGMQVRISAEEESSTDLKTHFEEIENPSTSAETVQPAPTPRVGTSTRGVEGVPEGKWEDLSSSSSPEGEGEIKKLVKIFHGKITKVNKIK
ncbi:MAG: DNA polymerase III subunit gamma/tau [Elusimicrobia bacterium]|nr:DNA polymerase III subunit gamma/tau [Elusimicrobiota bacterium]